MANAAPNLVATEVAERQEYWKPMVAPRPETAPVGDRQITACGRCGGQLAAGERFCPACGTESQAGNAGDDRPAYAGATWPELAALRRLFVRTPLSVAALVLGCVCIVAAVITGFVYNATTLVDWQAVQMWRIQWLLAAIAILLAGILLKKK